MRILFDEQIFFMQKFGGISRYYAKLAEQLDEIGQDVRLFSGINFNAYLPETNQKIQVGKSIERYPKKSLRLIKSLNNSWRIAYEKIYKPSIIHETYFAANQSHPSKAKVVVGVYDMIQEIYPQLFKQYELVTEEKKKAFHRADHIISISHQTKKDCIELFGIDEKKISVVHLAADPPIQDFSGVELGQERPFFLYVGQRNGYKNFTSLLKAFAQNEVLKKEMDILAFGGGGFNAEELKLIEQLGLKKNQVRYIGGSDRVLGKLYSEALALVYPSLYEGFGIPPLEAMTYACPVLASNTSCLPEIIAEGGLLFDPQNSDEFSYALTSIWESDSLKKELIARGEKRLAYFSWRKTAEETLKVYQQLL